MNFGSFKGEPPITKKVILIEFPSENEIDVYLGPERELLSSPKKFKEENHVKAGHFDEALLLIREKMMGVWKERRNWKEKVDKMREKKEK